MSDADKTARELYLRWLEPNGAGQDEQAVQVADQMLGLDGISPPAREWAGASKQTPRNDAVRVSRKVAKPRSNKGAVEAKSP